MSVFSKSVVQSIFKSFAKSQAVSKERRAVEDKAIQQAVDAMVIACDKPKAEFMKGNARTNEARAEVQALFMGLADAGAFSKGSVKSYVGSFWIAFEQGVPFQRDLFATANKSKTKAEGGAKAEGGTKAGAVVTTTLAAAHKTLAKAIEQYQTVLQRDFANSLMDLAKDTYGDDFAK